MPFLSSLFGSGSDSETSENSDFLAAIDSGVSLDVTNESYSQEVDDDGSSETSWDATSIGTDVDLGSILSSMTDSMSESDGGGLFA